jgi:predicted RNA-binding Zn ribbon-like protein
VLDFVNTRPVIDGRPVELLTDFRSVLRWFEATRLLSSGGAIDLSRQWGATAEAHATVRELQAWRERLRVALVAWEGEHGLPKSVLKELNHLMAEYPSITRLSFSGCNVVSESWFRLQTPESLFAPIAHNAAMLFATVDHKRVRKCGNCVLHFLDTSKKGTRRWCSMQLCGNRLKVAAYAERQRKIKPRDL